MGTGCLRMIDKPWANGDMDGSFNGPWHRIRIPLRSGNVVAWDGAYCVAKAFPAFPYNFSQNKTTLHAL